MKKIKKIGVLSVGKFLAGLYCTIGLIVGLIFSVLGLLSQSGSNPTPWFFNLAIVFFPILYGALGFFAGIIISFVYNIVAKTIGGIEIEIE